MLLKNWPTGKRFRNVCSLFITALVASIPLFVDRKPKATSSYQNGYFFSHCVSKYYKNSCSRASEVAHFCKKKFRRLTKRLFVRKCLKRIDICRNSTMLTLFCTHFQIFFEIFQHMEIAHQPYIRLTSGLPKTDSKPAVIASLASANSMEGFHCRL